jgi:hypothetical protein
MSKKLLAILLVSFHSLISNWGYAQTAPNISYAIPKNYLFAVQFIKPFDAPKS